MGEHSGNRTLAGATRLLGAPKRQDPAAISAAEGNVAALCSHLGIALGKVNAGLSGEDTPGAPHTPGWVEPDPVPDGTT